MTSDHPLSVGRALALPWLALALLFQGAAFASETPDPTSVTIPGDLQSELGCPSDWLPDCAATHIEYDAEDDVWQGTFAVPAGNWNYKVTLNDNWDENYGAGGVRDGGNIALDLSELTDVKFYYSHTTNWVADNVNEVIATAAGSFQSELGCSGDWQPWCLRSWLQDPDGDGVLTFTTGALPAGSYEVKVALDEDWTVNYGAGGAQNGPNIPFDVAADCTATTFAFDDATKLLTVESAPEPAQPSSVTIAGNLQSELGCPDDWQPDCAATHLTFDSEDQVWQGTFPVPVGDWEYKAPLNDSWDVNYGQNATLNGANIPLSVTEPSGVKFYYSDATHWVTDNINSTIATLAGNFQSELGCSGDWQPWCLRSWLQDPDGDGLYTWSTNRLPAGNYEVKIAHNESWDENYGLGGAQNGPNIPFTVPSSCAEIFFTYDPMSHELTIGTAPGGPAGNLALARTHWVSEDTLLWGYPSVPADATFTLSGSATGDLSLGDTGIEGADLNVELTPDPAGIDPSITARFPHLSGLSVLRIAAADLGLVSQLLDGRVAVSVKDAEGNLRDATSIQIPGVLDDLYTYDGPLGIELNAGVPTLRLWAPTARSISLLLFADADPATTSTTVPMVEDATTGVWSVTGDASWMGQYYLYEVEVYAPSTGNVEFNRVTDPYSLSLSANSARSQLVDLANPSLAPAGWTSLDKPDFGAPEDIVLYELHVRDFSWHDPAVPEIDRGTFRAFTHDGSHGMGHLRALSKAGLTHVHLLPAFDIATVTERRADQVEPDAAVLATYAPDSEEQQAAVTDLEDQDGFNWGYDPWHYTVPEGSYSTDPDGGQRILEFREMVQNLANNDLRVVMDVVYNHTNAAGQNGKSVLDRIVPGYYHRLSAEGGVEQSSCCPNTASEHNMMEKLMVDSLVTWAKDYKVDGFRFDLMGHHSKANLQAVRDALDALTLEEDGVDGRSIYLYGEGWNFGEVANNARFEQATQANMAGTGVGTFNDRIRDGARGGGPFSGLQEQGFLTGLFNDPNATDQGSPADQESRLKQHADWIRVSLTGNLRNYPLEDRFGNLVLGSEIDYNGQQAGYTQDPQEIINYVAAHDNETLFDGIQFKLPQSSAMAERVRVQNLGVSLVTLSQGVPFVHAGMDMLRSKSLDRDSFNSGDWFNKLDFTYQSNNWGVGLPVASKNQDNWPLMQPLLADPSLLPQSTDIQAAVAHFREVLAIRKSSKLFRLESGTDVMDRVGFLNTGPNQIPGLIVMGITDLDGSVDRTRQLLVVAFNGSDDSVDFTDSSLAGLGLEVHEIQQASADPVVRTATADDATGTLTVPGRTAAVFVSKRSAIDQIDLLIADVDALESSGILNRGQAKSLSRPLEKAQQRLVQGRTGSAIFRLLIFKIKTQLFVRAGILTPEEGEALITPAADVVRCLLN